MKCNSFTFCGTFMTPVINLQCPLTRQTSSNISVTINNLDSGEKQTSGGLSVYFGGASEVNLNFWQGKGGTISCQGLM